MTKEQRLQQAAFTRLVDKRVQERNLHAIRLRPQLLTPQQLSNHIAALPDVSEQATSFEEAQPALGLFDVDTLRRVQKNFQRYTQSTGKSKKK